jgi:hypothetical protein
MGHSQTALGSSQDLSPHLGSSFLLRQSLWLLLLRLWLLHFHGLVQDAQDLLKAAVGSQLQTGDVHCIVEAHLHTIETILAGSQLLLPPNTTDMQPCAGGFSSTPLLLVAGSIPGGKAEQQQQVGC